MRTNVGGFSVCNPVESFCERKQICAEILSQSADDFVRDERIQCARAQIEIYDIKRMHMMHWHAMSGCLFISLLHSVRFFTFRPNSSSEAFKVFIPIRMGFALAKQDRRLIPSRNCSVRIRIALYSIRFPNIPHLFCRVLELKSEIRYTKQISAAQQTMQHRRNGCTRWAKCATFSKRSQRIH